MENVRKRASRFINALRREELVVFVRGTTEGVTLVCQQLRRENIRAGDNIIMRQMGIMPTSDFTRRIAVRARALNCA